MTLSLLPTAAMQQSNPKMQAQAMGLLAEAMVMGTGPALERMERHEQASAVASTNLPRKCNGCQAQWEALGVVFGEPINELFRRATLPAGWSVKPTDHSMWNNIVDDRGRRRGQYFYKGAIYDRDAFLGAPNRRFTVRQIYRDTPDSEPDYDRCQFSVMDGETEIHRTEPRRKPDGDWKAREAIEHEVRTAAVAWLTERYPDHENPAAYWD